jgi:signal peptidase I
MKPLLTALSLLTLLSALALLTWARRGRVCAIVRGNSMAPTFHNGERVLARRYRSGSIDVGDVVIFLPSGGHSSPMSADPAWRIKRVAAIAGEQVPTWLAHSRGANARVPAGHLVVVGDNQRSQDSRQLGFVPLSAVIATTRRPAVES